MITVVAMFFVVTYTNAQVVKNSTPKSMSAAVKTVSDEDIWLDYQVIQKGKTVMLMGTFGGDVTNYYWDFGDGTTGHGAVHKHVYPAKGVYDACFIVEGKGAAKIECVTLFIGKQTN